jgi:hypothetical protein
MTCELCRKKMSLAVAKGTLLTFDADYNTLKLAAGSDDEYLVADSGETEGLKFKAPAAFFAYRTSAKDLTNANTWYDIAWEDAAATVKKGFTHDHTSNPEQITVTATGTYVITYSLSGYYAGTQGHFAGRLLDDGTEIPGSYHPFVRTYGNSMSKTVIADITAGSVIELQAGAANAGADIMYQDIGPDPTTTNCATISIERIY